MMTRQRSWRTFLAAAVAIVALPLAAAASPDAVLYEVTENMYFYDGSAGGGQLLDPNLILSGQVAPARRVADATLQGWARVGNPLCPSKLLATNPRATKCTVTAAGQDNISLVTGTGTVSGTYAVVINLDNATDAAEYVVQTGSFTGAMDLSMRPLGKISGTFTPTGTTLAVPFTGTFRLPFNLDTTGRKHEPKRGKAAYYLADDGKTQIRVDSSELSLGWPLVRLELDF